MRSDLRLANVPVVISTSDPTQAPGGVSVTKKPLNLKNLLNLVKQHSA
jgi:hypothetical protein